MGHKGDRVLLKNSCNLVKLVLLAASWGDRLKPVISQVSCNLMFLYGPMAACCGIVSCQIPPPELNPEGI